MSSTQATQQITPELRKWIVAQAEAGHAAEAVLKSMIASGWNEDVAVDAMESTLREHLEHQAVQKGLPPGVPVPEPRLEESPLYLDAGDRQVCVLQVMVNPRVIVFGGLLSDAECEQLIDLAKPRMARSLTVATKTGGEEVNADRTSNGMFFQRGEHPLVRTLEERIALLLNWPMENGEGLQILHYRPGTEYKPHYDYFDPAEPGTPTILKRGGQRVGTLVMYLGEPDKGGGTVFPDVNLEVAPKRGNAVFFSYDRAHPSTKTLHGGSPVLAGDKWIATKWLRERRFE
ncbi:2OG-Fe(II) oxygenase [Ramlibacter sp.]|uniref:2OG-Fe(II) oxygenase n=1 Tax=Ramlibacter sp. TaxID=1917967 RepID=UPI001824319D|nr:2OG-Fe(II) oxygenase [Ramlibacter sp.]MBA2675426.1 2OG-Fe(II) oxygenase [Ramlibacter sp.]